LTPFFSFISSLCLTLGGGILTVTRKSAVHSAIPLIVSLLGVAGLFLLQKAEFLFVAQIVLYIGGIMVLFLFVIMLVNLDEAARVRQFNQQWWLALACVLAVAAEIAYFLRKPLHLAAAPPPAPGGPGNVEPGGGPAFLAITCCPSRSLRCCCWQPWWARW